MGRFFAGALASAALLAGAIFFFWTRSDGGACLGRCGAGTRCADHQCVAAAVEPAHPAPPQKDPRRRRHAAGPGAATPEVTLRPGDEKMTAQGDALGRPERIDLSKEAKDDERELSQEDLDRVVHAAEPQISRCITDALGDAPLETGRVEIGLRVERSGEVKRLRVEAPALLVRQGLYRCLRGVVGALRFPASGGASVVTYPFELK
jgi:hypothetical protein